MILVAVADHGGDAGQGGDFLRRSLGIAAGDDDAGLGIGSTDAADVGAGVAVGLGGDGAGVHHDHIGVPQVGGGERVQAVEAGGDGVSVGLAGAASEIFHMEPGHPPV